MNLKHAVLRYGGFYYYGGANLQNNGGNLSVSNSIVEYSSNCGVEHVGGTTDVTNTIIRNNSTNGVRATGVGDITLTGNTFFNNANSAASINFGSGLVFNNANNTASGTGLRGFVMVGTLASSQVWNTDGVAYIISDLTIPVGNTLSINKGAVVKFQGTWDRISVLGTLNAKGTVDEPVYFTSISDDAALGDTNGNNWDTLPTPSDWSNINIQNTGTATFENANIRYGGFYYYGGGNLQNNGGNLSVSSSTIIRSASYGIQHIGGNTLIDHSSFNNNATNGINASGEGRISVANNSFTNNGNAASSLNFSSGLVMNSSGNTAFGNGLRGFVMAGSLISSQHWTKESLPFIISDLTIPVGSTLTIDSGAVIKFQGTWDRISVFGTLEANGSFTDPIYFTSLKDDDTLGDTNYDNVDTSPAPSDWSVIVLHEGGKATFSHSIVRYGGFYYYGGGNIYNDGGILDISDSSISHSSSYGVYHGKGTTTVETSTMQHNLSYGIYGVGEGKLSLTGNTFSDNPNSACSLNFSSGLVVINSGNTASGAGLRGFLMAGSLVSSQHWAKEGLSYIISDLTIPAGSLLTIDPGAVIKFQGTWDRLSVYGTLHANGTASLPIYFTSLKDDSALGDTNADGNIGDEAPSDWSVIVTQADGTSVFTHSIIRYGGFYYYGGANLQNNGGNLSVSYSAIEHGASYGIQHVGGTIILDHNSIKNNVSYGVYNSTATDIDATNNYWGSESGPYNPLQNGAGTGNRVSDHVLFDPWLHADPIGEIQPLEPEICTQDCVSVMFIPGIAGSQLYQDNASTPLWFPPLFNPTNSDVEKLFLNSSGSSVRNDITTRDGEIVEKAYGQKDIYQGLPELLNSLKNQHALADWKAISYDWRLDYETLLQNGKQTSNRVSYLEASSSPYILQELKRLSDKAGTHKVIIIAHSNGGLLAKALVKKLEESHSSLLVDIDQVIMIGTPQLGAPMSISSMLHGDEDPLTGLSHPSMSETTYRQFVENMPTMFNLLPSYAYNVPSEPYVKFDVPTGYANIENKAVQKYGSYEMDPLLDQMRGSYPYGTVTRDNLALFLTGEQGGRAKPSADDLTSPNVLSNGLFGNSVSIHANLDTYQFPSSVKVTQVAGWGLPTISGIEYFRGEPNCVILGILICKPTFALGRAPITNSDGDGTVPTWSSLSANDETKVFVDLKTYNTDIANHVITESVKNREHVNIIGSQPVKNVLEHLIKNESLANIAYTSVSKPSGTHYIMAEKHSPVDIDVYDSAGNHTGYVNKIIDGVSVRVIEENIPNSSYIEMGGSAYVIFPANEGVEVKLFGTGEGTMNFKLTEDVNDVETATTAFEDVPITPSFSGSITVDTVANTTPLSIDQNGDGITDISVDPKLNGVVTFDSVSPKTTATASGTSGSNGWYISDVSVTFTATDDDSGVKSTLYSTDKGISWKTAVPFSISTEGTTTIQYYSTDNAGNKEATSTLEVKIDKTAPEAKVSVDVTTKDLKIEGVDMNPTTITKDAKNTYIITDLAGHTTKLFFQKTFLGKLLTFAKLTGIQYDTATKVTLPSSSFLYLWNPLVNPPVLLSQTIVVNNTYGIEAVYDKKKNQTTVLLKKKGVQIQKQIFTGLRIIKLTLNKGVVGYEI